VQRRKEKQLQEKQKTKAVPIVLLQLQFLLLQFFAPSRLCVKAFERN
jgi:hypothetical protein